MPYYNSSAGGTEGVESNPTAQDAHPCTIELRIATYIPAIHVHNFFLKLALRGHVRKPDKDFFVRNHAPIHSQ